MIRQKAEIMDAQGIKRAITRIAHEILERNKGSKDVVMFGIEKRGLYLAHRISKRIKSEDDINIPIGSIDISFYEDGFSGHSKNPMINNISSNFSVENKIVIIVNDVIYTGRTAKAAVDAVMNLGSPRAIQIAQLIDRGHRELPIRADYVGKNISTSKGEIIHVKLYEVDGNDSVSITEIKETILM